MQAVENIRLRVICINGGFAEIHASTLRLAWISMAVLNAESFFPVVSNGVGNVWTG